MCRCEETRATSGLVLSPCLCCFVCLLCFLMCLTSQVICLHCKCFTNWAISPAPNIFFLWEMFSCELYKLAAECWTDRLSSGLLHAGNPSPARKLKSHNYLEFILPVRRRLLPQLVWRRLEREKVLKQCILFRINRKWSTFKDFLTWKAVSLPSHSRSVSRYDCF